MSEWIELLKRATDAEFQSRPRIVCLATVDQNGAPSARSVVCRGIEPDGSVWITSHRFSAKNNHLRKTPLAEIVFWLQSQRVQFRVAGTVRILSADSDHFGRTQLWRAMPDATRATFMWPDPGGDVIADESAYPAAVPADVPVPETFETLILNPLKVELLDLNHHPHGRLVWLKSDGLWEVSPVNP